MPDSLRRLAPLTGVVFAVLLATTFILTGDTPDQGDSGQQVISFYQDHHAKIVVGNLWGRLASPSSCSSRRPYADTCAGTRTPRRLRR